MKRKAVLENLARNLYEKYKKQGREPAQLIGLNADAKIYRQLGVRKERYSDIVIFKLEFKEMKREMFSGIDFGEYDQQTLYGAIRREYLEAPIWCRERNAGDYLVEYMMIKEGASGNYVQVEIRNFELGVYKK